MNKIKKKISFIFIQDLDVTGNSEEEEEKQKLIERVLELQSTLEGSECV